MACRELDLTVDCASNLEDVNLVSKLKVYVVVSLDGNPSCPQKSKSPLDVDNGPNPKWSFNVKLYVDEPSAQQNRLTIHFKLRCKRPLGDRDIGEVVIRVKELLDSSAADGTASSLTYPVHVPSGKPKGQLEFSYKFSDKLTPEVGAPGHSASPKVDVPVMGYPDWAGASGPSGTGHLPPPSNAPASPLLPRYLPPPSNAYAPPPPPGYAGQPPPQARHGSAQLPPPGYGYYPNQQAQQAPKKTKIEKELGVRFAGFAGGHMLAHVAGAVAGAVGAGGF